MKPGISRTIALLIPCLAILIAACTPVSTPAQGEVETVVAVTFAAMTESVPAPAPSTTFMPIPKDTAGPTLVPTGKNYLVQTTAQNVNLRVGPGTLFKVSRVMAQGTSLEVIGVSRGGEWFYVINTEGINGWVLVQLVSGEDRGASPPVVDPTDASLVTGMVKTVLGTPVSGIGFALTQVGSSTRRTDAVTDAEGRFFAYIPSTLSGSWLVEFVSVACTSNTMDVNCNCISGRCGKADPPSVQIILPSTSELNFVWK